MPQDLQLRDPFTTCRSIHGPMLLVHRKITAMFKTDEKITNHFHNPYHLMTHNYPSKKPLQTNQIFNNQDSNYEPIYDLYNFLRVVRLPLVDCLSLQNYFSSVGVFYEPNYNHYFFYGPSCLFLSKVQRPKIFRFLTPYP